MTQLCISLGDCVKVNRQNAICTRKHSIIANIEESGQMDAYIDMLKAEKT